MSRRGNGGPGWHGVWVIVYLPAFIGLCAVLYLVTKGIMGLIAGLR